MGSKDHRKREIKKPKKQTPQLPSQSKRGAPREDFNQAAFRPVQETIRRSES